MLALLIGATPVRASVDPSKFADLGFRQHPGAELPLDAKIVDSAGRNLPLGAALAGKPTILVLEYLRCKNLCSLVLGGATQAMIAAGLDPGRDVKLVAISIDPSETSAEAASAQAMYARRFPDPNAETGVRFFTGAPTEVRRIAEAIGFPYRYDKESGQFLHPAGFVVTTSDGKISRYLLGLSPNAPILKKAVAEAALDKVEPPAHPLLCLCFGYDPEEGSVAALTLRLVRIASAGLVIACAGLISFLSLRRRAA